MPQVDAFKGTHYNPETISDLADVTAPPYDVITGPLKTELLERSPYNVIRLILGKAAQEAGTGARPQNEFEQAAARGVRSGRQALLPPGFHRPSETGGEKERGAPARTDPECPERGPPGINPPLQS